MRCRLNHLSVVLVVLLTALSVGPGQAVAQESALTKPVVLLKVTGTSIELSWESVEGAARYDVWQWDQGNGWKHLDDGNLTDTTFTQADLTVGVTYFYAVRAVAEGTTSDYSEYVSATIEAGASPTSTSTPIPTQAADSGPTPYPTYTPYPTATPYPTYTPYPTFTPVPVAATAMPAPTVDPSESCVLIKYADGDERWPSITAPLVQNETVVAYRNKYGENLEDLDIVQVDYFADGRVAVWYLGDGDRYNIKRLVGEYFRGCQFIGHTDWGEVEY